MAQGIGTGNVGLLVDQRFEESLVGIVRFMKVTSNLFALFLGIPCVEDHR